VTVRFVTQVSTVVGTVSFFAYGIPHMIRNVVGAKAAVFVCIAVATAVGVACGA
jgi:hypothetical protein